MSLRFIDTGTSGAPASIRTFIDKLQHLNSLYAQTNDGEGIPDGIMKTKILELPRSYDMPLQYIENQDATAARMGLGQMDVTSIISYLIGWENRRDRRGSSLTSISTRGSCGRGGRRKYAPGRGHSYLE